MERKIAVVCIGDELLIGQVTDTNSGDIARYVEPRGWQVTYVQITGDDKRSIKESIDRAFDVSNVVITTGGLGPTKDDITKSVLLEYFGGELKEDPAVLENVKKVIERRGLKINDLTAAQAIVPTSCRVIQNRVGTAPVMWFEKNGKILVAMPGVPFETREMFRSEVFPILQQKFPSNEVLLHHTVLVSGISESALATLLEPWENSLPEGFHLAYLPKPGLIRLRFDGHFAKGSEETVGRQTMDALTSELIALCGDNFLYDGDMTPAEILLAELKDRKMTVSTAESCTGGGIASALTAIPGASEAVLCGVVAYSNSIKQSVLGVNPTTLMEHGAVSLETVSQMAEGARRISGSDIAIATSGIAGPGGATKTKPVGTVAIAIADSTGCYKELFHFPGDRQRVIERSVMTALVLAIRCLRAANH
ncbi:MAG: CinA family nicotinamide mononucleotide deamidase-related protein [Paramuribaculum sp.]|nr:CinA family nicotinamide mononucleotide deamidase-related protein [Paramuribaculum sp.]